MQLELVKYKPDKSSQQEKDGENIREDGKKKKSRTSLKYYESGPLFNYKSCSFCKPRETW